MFSILGLEVAKHMYNLLVRHNDWNSWTLMLENKCTCCIGEESTPGVLCEKASLTSHG